MGLGQQFKDCDLTWHDKSTTGFARGDRHRVGFWLKTPK